MTQYELKFKKQVLIIIKTKNVSKIKKATLYSI